MTIKLITAPASEPITLAEAKAHLRVDSSDDDSLITALIVAAREQAEQRTLRALITQTWELVLDEFPEACVLHRPPIIAITSVKYLDLEGTQQTLASSSYLLDNDSEPGYVVPAYGYDWPDTYEVPNAVRVRYTAGYGAAAAVPQSIKQWMFLAIGTMYRQRETFVAGLTVSPLPNDFWCSLLDTYMVWDR